MQEAQSRPGAVQLDERARSGAGDGTSVRVDDWADQPFPRSKQVVSYLGFNPSEESSGRPATVGCDQQARQRDAALPTGRSRPDCLQSDPELRRDYQRLKFRRG